MAEGSGGAYKKMHAKEGPSGGQEIKEETDVLSVEVQYRQVEKKPAVLPKFNEEKQLSLDGVVKPPGATIATKFATKLTSSRKSTEIPNVSIAAALLPPKLRGVYKKKAIPQVTEDEKTDQRRTKCDTSIASLKLAVKFNDNDSDDDDGLEPDTRDTQSTIDHSLHGIGYMRGLAFSSFYNRDFSVVPGYLKRELPPVLEFSPGSRIQRFQYDIALTDLECDLYLEECNETDRKCTKLDEEVFQAIQTLMVSLSDLVHWIEALRSSSRHYGSILLCRALILGLPKHDESSFTVWYFDFGYFMFVEMCLRAVYMLGKKTTYSNVTKFIFDSMDKAICKLKASSLGHRDPSKSEYTRNKVGVCYLALSYFCNGAELYESAERCVEDGLQILPEHSNIKPDLLLNQAVSFLGRGDDAKALLKVKEAEDLLLMKKPKSTKLRLSEKILPKGSLRIRLIEDMRKKIGKQRRETTKGLLEW